MFEGLFMLNSNSRGRAVGVSVTIPIRIFFTCLLTVCVVFGTTRAAQAADYWVWFVQSVKQGDIVEYPSKTGEAVADVAMILGNENNGGPDGEYHVGCNNNYNSGGNLLFVNNASRAAAGLGCFGLNVVWTSESCTAPEDTVRWIGSDPNTNRTCADPCGDPASQLCKPLACAAGLFWNGETCVANCPSGLLGGSFAGGCAAPSAAAKNVGPKCPECNQTTNPIKHGDGRKLIEELPVSIPTLSLNLTYDSTPKNLLPRRAYPFGIGWGFNYGMRVWIIGGGKAVVLRPSGRFYEFAPPASGDTYVADADVPDTLTRVTDGTNVTGYTYTRAADDAVENYDANGKLTSIVQRNGQTTTFTYSDASTPGTVAPSRGLLITVTDQFGRSMQLTYNSAARVNQVSDPAGNQYNFYYDEASSVVLAGEPAGNNLTSIEFPGLNKRIFHYNEQIHTNNTNLPNAMTGITDENGDRHSIYQYNADGLAISSELAGGVERYSVTYNPDGSSAVTDPRNTVRSYDYQIIQRVTKTNDITGGANTFGSPDAMSYDANGFISSETDWNGNLTTYLRQDPNGRLDLETSRTEASGTPQARTITTDWHATYRLPTLITEPGKSTAFTYDANGNLLTRTVTDTASGASRTWTYTYNAIGQVLSMDGPRTDVSDLTTYSYDAVTGDLLSITNPLSQTTQITSYDANGRPLTIVDPNGLTTTLTYHPRGWLASRDVGGELTAYAYDNVGQLTKVTLPDGSFLDYSYDAAHRLTGITDNLGNAIAYTLDTMGNRTREDVRDPVGALSQTRSRVFNSLNRLVQDIGGTNPTGQVTSYAYDAQGNLTNITDPLSRITTNGYDALNRLVQITDPATGVTQYGYNAIDQLTSVIDPRSNTTSYNLDALDNLNSQISPDTGTTSNSFDAAGNVLTSTDAKGQTTTYTYDALNRVATVTYHDNSSVTYGYDAGINGTGRLTSITENAPDASLTTQTLYTYDVQGRVLTDTRNVGTQSYVTQYGYDAAGRLASVTYPTGMVITHGFDGLGRVQRITATRDGTAQVLIDGVAYHPFGGVKSFVFGNGESYTRGIDLDGRINSYTLANFSHAVTWDDAGRITALPATANAAQAQTYGYDNLDRLTSAVNATNAHSYSYDILGNRLSYTVGTATTTYQYPASSNRLDSITAPAGAVSTVVHDANGSIIDDGTESFTYDTRGRLTGAQSALGPVTYQVNNLGQRYQKTVQGVTTVFHYDSAGHLIAETDASGVTQVEYVWLGDQPVAMFR